MLLFSVTAEDLVKDLDCTETSTPAFLCMQTWKQKEKKKDNRVCNAHFQTTISSFIFVFLFRLKTYETFWWTSNLKALQANRKDSPELWFSAYAKNQEK